jgi:hypothetical protein
VSSSGDSRLMARVTPLTCRWQSNPGFRPHEQWTNVASAGFFSNFGLNQFSARRPLLGERCGKPLAVYSSRPTITLSAHSLIQYSSIAPARGARGSHLHVLHPLVHGGVGDSRRRVPLGLHTGPLGAMRDGVTCCASGLRISTTDIKTKIEGGMTEVS